MCKYCEWTRKFIGESNGVFNPDGYTDWILQQKEDENGILSGIGIYIEGKDLNILTAYATPKCEDGKYIKHSDSVQIDFCPKCGTPLGEVKPLTVEQLRQMDGKPVFVVGNGEKEWCIMNVNPNNSDRLNGAYIAGNECSWYELSLYLESWVAYSQEPKGEAE